MTVAAYVGCPRSGKSTLALSHAGEDVRRTGWPLLVVNWQGVATFSRVRSVDTLAGAVDSLWSLGSSCQWRPPSLDEFARLMDAVIEGGKVNVLIDEARWCLSAASISRPLSLLLRSTQHTGDVARALPLNVRLTTQAFRDLHSDALACVEELIVFRCTAPRDLERLRGEYGMDSQAVRSLPRFEFIRQLAGFA